MTEDERQVMLIEKKATAFELHRQNFPAVLQHLVEEHNPSFDSKKLSQMIRDFEDDGVEITKKWHDAIAAQKDLNRKAIKLGRDVLAQI